MCGEGLVVSFCRLVLLALARLKETPDKRHGVRGPLLKVWGEEFVHQSAVFLGLVLFEVLSRADCSAADRSATIQRKIRVYDETLGYPGEDIILAFLLRDNCQLC